MRRALGSPLAWALAALVALVFGLPHAEALFAALFPTLDRPIYRQDTFIGLTLAHLGLVALSSLVAIAGGMGVGIFITRRAGREFRPLLESLVAIGQAFPPVAVLAVAAPLIGFGAAPAIIALALYGLLPVVQATAAGIDAVPADVSAAAQGLGMSPAQRLLSVELPLAFPVILAGVRTSVVINIGTAAIASTVGARTLGTPIIVGLAGFNTAYVIQGALLVALLALVVDMALGRLGARVAGATSAP